MSILENIQEIFDKQNNLEIQFTTAGKEIYENGDLLGYATEFSAGFDLRNCNDHDLITILPNERVFINIGIKTKIHNSFMAQVCSRSGIGTKKGLVVAQGIGIIDSDYRGEWKICLLNTSAEPQTIVRGERIAQAIIVPFDRVSFKIVNQLEESSRGDGGFGSSGHN